MVGDRVAFEANEYIGIVLERQFPDQGGGTGEIGGQHRDGLDNGVKRQGRGAPEQEGDQEGAHPGRDLAGKSLLRPAEIGEKQVARHQEEEGHRHPGYTLRDEHADEIGERVEIFGPDCSVREADGGEVGVDVDHADDGRKAEQFKPQGGRLVDHCRALLSVLSATGSGLGRRLTGGQCQRDRWRGYRWWPPR